MEVKDPKNPKIKRVVVNTGYFEETDHYIFVDSIYEKKYYVPAKKCEYDIRRQTVYTIEGEFKRKNGNYFLESELEITEKIFDGEFFVFQDKFGKEHLRIKIGPGFFDSEVVYCDDGIGIDRAGEKIRLTVYQCLGFDGKISVKGGNKMMPSLSEIL